jgi:glutamyl-tRNA synthetase
MRQEQQSRGEFVKYDRRCLSLSEEEVQARMDRGEKHVLRLRMPDKRRFIF